MNADKASTLRLLREGMGNSVTLLESRGGDSGHVLRAHLPDCSDSSMIPILFLLTSLAFLEASPCFGRGDEMPQEFLEVDGWTPADFLSYLRFEDGKLRISLEHVRGRAVFTEITLVADGTLEIQTRARGQSATRWLAYVRGRRHLQEVTTN